MTHFIPTQNEISSEGIANLYLQNVWKLHGLPSSVVSDRGTQFASNMMRDLNKALNIQTKLSTAYHPQTDGQTEWFNQKIEAYLCMFCSQRHNNWVHWIPIAKFALNSRVHSATGFLPFYLTYGYKPQFHIPMVNTEVPAAV